MVYFCRASAVVLVGVLIALVAASPTKGWSGRSLSLLDPYVFVLFFTKSSCLLCFEYFALSHIVNSWMEGVVKVNTFSVTFLSSGRVLNHILALGLKSHYLLNCVQILNLGWWGGFAAPMQANTFQSLLVSVNISLPPGRHTSWTSTYWPFWHQLESL